MSAKQSKKKASSSDDYLLPDERINFNELDTQSKASDEDLNKRYVRGEVRIVTESARYPLANILTMLEERVDPGDGSQKVPRYQLDPEYQRRHRWDDKRKSKLIESFLINIPIPPVFLYEQEFARYEVMDGRQRLIAIKEFYEDKLVLDGLEYWPELDKKTYSKLPSKVREGIDRRYISSIILLKETASSDGEKEAELKKIVFERLNSGGVRLRPQETRNAIYNGPLNKLCLELSENAQFRAMWGIPMEPIPGNDEDDDEDEDTNKGYDGTKAGQQMFQKMDDVELVLRFFAYRHIDKFNRGLNKVSDLLDRFLKEGNRFPVTLLGEFRDMFERTISFLYDILGANAFRRLDRKGKPKKQPAKIVYDPLMYIASRYAQDPHREKFVRGRDVLLKQLGAMYEERAELFAGRRTNSKDVQDRNSCMEKAFNAALEELK